MKESTPQDIPPDKLNTKKWLIPVLVGFAIFVSAFLVWIFLINNTAQAPAPSSTHTELNAPKIELKLLASGLAQPTAIVATNDTQDTRLFALEQAGRIRIINSDEQLVTQPFLDITQKVLNSGEMGLLGLAFHPAYKQNGYFYINYVNKSQETIIARYKVSAQPDQADPNSEKVLLRLKQPYSNHNGGDLQFGPDGFLYITLGDGGSGGDPQNQAQDKTSLFGKILRIDVDSGDPYGIPISNPFVNQTGTKPEIWAYGLRNPWRISFDTDTGDLYIADVGQGEIEEVNLQKSTSKGGENYGWRCYEGTKTYNTSGCLEQSKYTSPIFEYNHEEERCSITGGHVYRGSDYPTLAGKYFYGDFCNGQLFYAENNGGEWLQNLVNKTPYAFSTFGQDSSKELYVADFSTGNIYKIIDTAN